jgi:Tfp pilus assembly protein PilF
MEMNADLLGQAKDHLQAQRLDMAQSICEQIIAINPDYDEAHLLLASVYLGRGGVPFACECYRAAALIHPDSAIGHMAMGVSHRFSGDLGAAVTSFRKALQFDPDEAPVWTLLRVTQIAARARRPILTITPRP